MALLSDIFHVLYFHRSPALSLKLQSENAGSYVHFVFIYKSLYLLADFQNFYK